jgi:hypothetical protein
MEMTSNRWTRRGLVMSAATAAMLLSAHPGADAARMSAARMNFDGPWSVVVVTDYGSCDRAYRYGVQIVNGQVFYRGNAGVNIFGRVTPRGQVSVQVQQGNQQATGTGQLTEDSGGGRWSGASPERQCGGHWIAERRG